MFGALKSVKSFMASDYSPNMSRYILDLFCWELKCARFLLSFLQETLQRPGKIEGSGHRLMRNWSCSMQIYSAATLWRCRISWRRYRINALHKTVHFLRRVFLYTCGSHVSQKQNERVRAFFCSIPLWKTAVLNFIELHLPPRLEKHEWRQIYLKQTWRTRSAAEWSAPWPFIPLLFLLIKVGGFFFYLRSEFR